MTISTKNNPMYKVVEAMYHKDIPVEEIARQTGLSLMQTLLIHQRIFAMEQIRKGHC